MKIVVGLGNPGNQYDRTRHNIGFEVVEFLGRRWQAPLPRTKFEALLSEVTFAGERVLLVAPQTFMNLSGRSVHPLMKFHQAQPTDVLVVCDDLNLKLGQIRLRASGSAGGQKGLQNILQVLGTDAISRLRLGIGRPAPPLETVEYVLGRFPKGETPVVEEMVVTAANAVEMWVKDGLAAAMNQFNGLDA